MLPKQVTKLWSRYPFVSNFTKTQSVRKNGTEQKNSARSDDTPGLLLGNFLLHWSKFRCGKNFLLCDFKTVTELFPVTVLRLIFTDSMLHILTENQELLLMF